MNFKYFLRQTVKLLIVSAIIYVMTLSGAMFMLPDGAYIHIGDAGIYLAALFLPTHIALPAAVIGCALADLSLGAVNYVLATVIVKALTVVFIKGVSRLSEKPLTRDLLVCLAGVVTIVGYYVADVIKAIDNSSGFINAMSIATSPIMYNTLQALICALLFALLSPVVQRYITKRGGEKE